MMRMHAPPDARAEFLKAAVWHGTLDHAENILAQQPRLRTSDVFTAAVLGDASLVRQFIAEDASVVTLKNGPYDAEPLVYLALSRYLRLNKERSADYILAAVALLDAGANPNAGFTLNGEFESALYGAAGVAHNAELTKLLLDRGAVPDGEVCYHVAEGYDLGAMQELVRSGKVNDDDLTLLLVRKVDWHDEAGIRWLLANGAAASRAWHNGLTAFLQALRRDNSLATIEMLLDHGADPLARYENVSGVALAARAGRSDVLRALAKRGVPTELSGLDGLIAACAMGDSEHVQRIAREDPARIAELRAHGGKLLAAFVGSNNEVGVRQLLDLGVPVDALWRDGDSYWGVAPNSLAIHVAAWRLRHRLVQLLIERGSPVNVRDAKGRTPLQLAVNACVDSYWKEFRAPDAVSALINAGASLQGVRYPSGYPDVDAILANAGAARTDASDE